MRRAVDAAMDLSALAVLRSSLRARFKVSPLGGDGQLLAREVEKAYRDLWAQFCAQA